jgi:hypothetical protein
MRIPVLSKGVLRHGVGATSPIRMGLVSSQATLARRSAPRAYEVCWSEAIDGEAYDCCQECEPCGSLPDGGEMVCCGSVICIGQPRRISILR